MNTLICGVDEVGRGCLFGPVVAASVILNSKEPILGLRDSKQLSAKRREQLFEEITDKALAWSIGRSEASEIDHLNILQASLLAMKRSVEALKILPSMVLIDGNQAPDLAYHTRTIIKGDTKVLEISAASIIAKVFRDREMMELDKKYPQYQLGSNKGYPTKAHLKALQIHGVTDLHRRSFKPVALFLSNNHKAV